MEDMEDMEVSILFKNLEFIRELQTQTHECSKESAACGVTITGSLSLPLQRVHTTLCRSHLSFKITFSKVLSYFLGHGLGHYGGESMLNAISLYNLSVAYRPCTIVRP